MFSFLKNLILKSKARKVALYTEAMEEQLLIFRSIESVTDKNKKFVRSLQKVQLYSAVVLRYNECGVKIENHNKTIQELTLASGALMQTYPITDLIDNILQYDRKKIEEMYSLINRIFSYNIPDSFQYKKQLETYKLKMEEILRDYDLIVEQKKLIELIKSEIENLPDVYINHDNKLEILGKTLKKIEKYSDYMHKYFSIPVSDVNSIIEKHNEIFISRHLEDVVFDNIDGKCLDFEQRRAVLCDSKSNLTIAGAGSGKTLTICGKVKYLLDTGLAKKDEILLLSYSRASANDLERKMKNIEKDVSVETFHAFGFKILTECNGKKKAVEEQLKSYIRRFFDEEISKDYKLANEIFQYLALYFYAEPVLDKEFKDDGEIYKKLKTLNYKTLKDCLRKLSADKERKETLKNEFVKSNEELVIANYLFINGINYEYEKPYEIDTSTMDKRPYTPDFYLSDYGIYLEHYGINREGYAPQYNKEKSDEYVCSMDWKRQIHAENQTTCIETFSYEFSEGIIFDNLKSRLLENGVEFKPLSQEEVINALHNVYQGSDFGSFFNLVMTFISLYKAEFKDEGGFLKLKSKVGDSGYNANRTRLFLNICRDIYNYYMHHLREADKIDFDDMILQAVDKLDATSNFKFKYIIVDEFQDISQSRARFLKKLMEHGNAKLFAVGDDWQSIYRFAGCDLNIFLDFENIFPEAKLNYITSTYRNSVELQQIAEPFITANPNQYIKHIKSVKHQENPIRIMYHNGDKATALTEAFENIAKSNPNAEVLVLGRNRHDIDFFVGKRLKVVAYKTIQHYDYPKLKISYSTVHGAKGLESDFVVLISGEDELNGFPNKIEDDDVLDLVLSKKSDFKYDEERRLFYVALTRTKSVVYLLANKSRPSEFIQEIENVCGIFKDINAITEDNKISCPWCKSGQLIERKSKIDGKSFYGCSNFPYCTYTNNNIVAVHHDMRCPKCGDFLVLKKGRRGTFLSCHNYPRCRYIQSDMKEKRRIGFYE